MKPILSGRLSFEIVGELQEVEGGKWQRNLLFHSSVKQTVFMSGLIRDGYKKVSVHLDIHSPTHKLLVPALLAHGRVDLISGEECELELCFTKTISPSSIILLKLTSYCRGTLDNGLTDHIEIGIPAKGIQSRDMSPGALLGGLELPQELPGGTLVI